MHFLNKAVTLDFVIVPVILNNMMFLCSEQLDFCSGNRVFAELHLSLDGSLSIQEAHDFTDHLEWDVENELPDVDLIIHVEPPRKKV